VTKKKKSGALGALVRVYDALINGMAGVAAFLMAAMMIVICVDVALRNLGYQSSAHFFTFTEYALLMVPCMGAPWLVRQKGHIYVEILLMTLQPRLRRRMTVVIGLVCIATCLVLAWFGFGITLEDFLQNEKDVRSLDMPRWLVVVWIPLGFFLMAVEFARYLWRRENFLAPLADIA
jgi:TRAP-type C4-dicarboxylate transport system permease small subunit